MIEELNEEVKTEEVAQPEEVEMSTPVVTEEPQMVVDQTGATEVVATNTSAGEFKEFYNYKEITARLGVFDASGAEECSFADGTTGFVPKSLTE